jgi:hypothetical protein
MEEHFVSKFNDIPLRSNRMLRYLASHKHLKEGNEAIVKAEDINYISQRLQNRYKRTTLTLRVLYLLGKKKFT